GGGPLVATREAGTQAAEGTSEVVLSGVPAVPGRALGPVVLYHRPDTAGAPAPIALSEAAVAREQSKVRAALATAAVELEQLAGELLTQIGSHGAAIFEAQSLIATDPALTERAVELVASQRLPAPDALLAAADDYAQMVAALDDAYLRERAADI